MKKSHKFSSSEDNKFIGYSKFSSTEGNEALFLQLSGMDAVVSTKVLTKQS